MKQQWQQMTDQQKKLAVVLIVVIVLAVILIAWQLMPRPRPQVSQEAGVEISGPTPAGAPGFEQGAPPPPGGAIPGEPMGEAGLVSTPPTTSPAGALGEAPTVGAPPVPQGKLSTPPKPGRSDPFADLGNLKPLSPVTIDLPPAPPPVLIARSGAIGTETFALQEPAPSLPSLQGQSVDIRTYFTTPQQREPVDQQELSGWRLSGTMLSESSISAIVQLPDGRTRTVRPGDRISFGGRDFLVTRVEEQRVSLQDEEGKVFFVPRRATVTITQPGPGGMGAPFPGPPTGYGLPMGYGGMGRPGGPVGY